MAERPDRLVAVVRHREAVLGCRERDGGTEPRWTLPTLPFERSLDRARRALLDALEVGTGTIDRRGPPMAVDDRVLLPVLMTIEDRPDTPPEHWPSATWTPPTVLRRQESDRWWRVYAAVAPTVDSVRDDTVRGSTAIAADALWVLRDAAIEAAATGGDVDSVRPVAEALLDARPAMAALENRINRAMAGRSSTTAIERAATDGIVQSHAADAGAARLAAETVAGGRVLTLSRSGTVREALLAANPETAVLVSRPGGEGREMTAELIASGLAVTSVADADVYEYLRSGDVDSVLVGADAVTRTGGVVNKAGTWALAHAAGRSGVPVLVAAASDKIRPAATSSESRFTSIDPMFDCTPPAFVTAVLMERGRLTPDAIRAIAREHQALAEWRY